MGEKVKRIKRELKYRGTILDMYCDHVEVNGHIAKWDYLQHKGAAAVIPVTKEGKILMVRQYRNALDRYTLEIPELWIHRGNPAKSVRQGNWRRRRDFAQKIWNG